jgi:hypothetical protein
MSNGEKPRVKPVGARAVATVTIEIGGLGSWGTDCSLEQVHRQAQERARDTVTRLISGSGRIVGDIEIKAIITER